MSSSCRNSDVLLTLVFLRLNGIKGVVKHLYTDGERSSAGQAQFKPKWAVCGPPCKISLTSQAQSEGYGSLNNLFQMMD